MCDDSSHKSSHTGLLYIICLYRLKAPVSILVLATVTLYLFVIGLIPQFAVLHSTTDRTKGTSDKVNKVMLYLFVADRQCAVRHVKEKQAAASQCNVQLLVGARLGLSLGEPKQFPKRG